MATTLVNNDDQLNSHSIVIDPPPLHSAPGIDSETDLDPTNLIENVEKQQSSIKPLEVSQSIRPWSQTSTLTQTNQKKSKTRSYQYIQLERALTSANLFKTNDDRLKFENDYLHSIEKNQFEKFLNTYYEKIYQHKQKLEKDAEFKRTRMFTFVDLEKNFLSLDPTRDVKILFLDDPTTSTISKIANSRSIPSAQQKKAISLTNDTAVESFYTKRSATLLKDPSRARDETTLFARRQAERLHQSLPRLTSVPHRVKIVDDRDTSGKPDQRTLLQLKHKHALTLINKRRHLVMKMITQTKKNQIKMEHQWNGTPIAIDSALCCKELLERANQIEDIVNEEQRRQRPQTAAVLNRRVRANETLSSYNSSETPTTMNSNLLPSFTTTSIPFKDSLSIHHVEKTKNVKVLLPNRPVTAPTKVNWVNYC